VNIGSQYRTAVLLSHREQKRRPEASQGALGEDETVQGTTSVTPVVPARGVPGPPKGYQPGISYVKNPVRYKF